MVRDWREESKGCGAGFWEECSEGWSVSALRWGFSEGGVVGVWID